MRRQRKSMSQINVVPYIDVMLVLLVIFMVTAPLVSPGEIELPTVGSKLTTPVQPISRTTAAPANRYGSTLRRWGGLDTFIGLAVAGVGGSGFVAIEEGAAGTGTGAACCALNVV